MIRKIPIIFLLFTPALLNTAFAHHSTRVFYNYDHDIEIVGTVTWVFWRNPHVRFNITRTGGGSSEEIWELEAGSMNTLDRFGIGESTIQVGDVVRVAGRPSRHGLNTMYVSNVLFENGKEVSLQNSQRLRWTTQDTSPPSRIMDSGGELTLPDVNGIFRVWSRGQGGRQENLPFTTAALEKRETWDPLIDDPALRCSPPGMPSAMANPYPIAFEQKDDAIILRLEEWDGLRTIHMESNAIADNLSSTPMGYSVGRWEENTLIVSTTNINYPYFDSIGTPQSKGVEIYERLTLSEDDRRLDYRMTITDSETFTAPAEFVQHYIWEPREEIKPYECTLAE
ncbi:MAG TPA: hypothetical protein EYM99_08140 [Alphaproteobacteria bacterium]|nr:hypothetical protein [Alphaproteobacteria bacterium]